MESCRNKKASIRHLKYDRKVVKFFGLRNEEHDPEGKIYKSAIKAKPWPRESENPSLANFEKRGKSGTLGP